MKTRIITAVALVLILFPIIAYGGIPFRLLELFVVIVGGIEMMGLSQHHRRWPKLIMPFSILIVVVVFLLNMFHPQFLFAFMTAVILGYISLPVFSENFTSSDSFLCLSYIMLFFFALHSLEQVLAYPIYIWLILIATYGCDTGAYFGGRFRGKHKMNERVSPKKTWEGAVCGWVSGCLLSIVIGLALLRIMPQADMRLFWLSCFIMPLSGQYGDLAFSSMKRCYHIKDFGNLLPGHGGVLDRLDSLLFNFMAFGILAMVVMAL